MKRHGDSDSGRRRVRRAGARPAAAARASTQPRGRRPLACPFRWTLLTHTIGERIVAAVICADSLAVLAVHVGDRHTVRGAPRAAVARPPNSDSTGRACATGRPRRATGGAALPPALPLTLALFLHLSSRPPARPGRPRS